MSLVNRPFLRLCLPSHFTAMVLVLFSVSVAGAQVVDPEKAIGVDVARIDSEPVLAAHGPLVVMVAGHPGIPCASRFGWTYSLDGGSTWSPYELLGSNTNLFGQPALTADASGHFYLANARCQAGAYRMAVTRGAISGGAFVWETRVDVTPVSSSELLDLPSIVVEPTSGAILLVYTARRSLGGVAYDAFVLITRSVDAGATWSTPLTLSSASGEGGDIAAGPDGEVYVIWADRATESIVGRKSVDQGVSFGPEFVVASTRPNYNTLSPGWQGIYDRSHPEHPYGRYFASDFPSVAVDRSSGPHRGRVHVTWTEMAAGALGAASGQAVSLSAHEPAQDVGRKLQGCDGWPFNYYAGAVPVTIGSDISGSFASADQNPCLQGPHVLSFEASAGTTLWIRGSVGFSPPPPFGLPPPPFTYRVQCGADTTELVDIGVPQLQGAFQFGYAPPYVLTLPRTGRYYFRLQGGGSYAIGYSLQLRSYQFAAGEAARDHRDVVLASSGDGGATWSPKVRVNDDPPGFDNALADLAVDGLGNLHVAWYDRREDQACGGAAKTYWTVSNDGGQTFASSRPLSGGPSYWPFPYSTGYTIGDKLGLWAEGDELHAAWVDFRAGGNPDIFYTKVHDVVTSTVVRRFEAAAEEERVVVRWSVLEGVDLTSFAVERAGNGEEFATVATVAADGRSEYAMADATVEPGAGYLYRLAVRWRDGRTSFEGPVAVTVPAVASALALGRPAPSPFSDRVSVELTLFSRGAVDACVYDLLGHEVKMLHRGDLAPGRHTLSWDGRDRAGRRVASGIYVVRARQGAHGMSRNLLMVR